MQLQSSRKLQHIFWLHGIVKCGIYNVNAGFQIVVNWRYISSIFRHHYSPLVWQLSVNCSCSYVTQHVVLHTYHMPFPVLVSCIKTMISFPLPSVSQKLLPFPFSCPDNLVFDNFYSNMLRDYW